MIVRGGTTKDMHPEGIWIVIVDGVALLVTDPPPTSSTPMSDKKNYKKDDIWHVTRDTWQVGGGEPSPKNFSTLALTVWEWRCSEDMEEKADSVNHSVTEVFVEQPRLHRVC